MFFEINNSLWKIVEKPQKAFWDESGEIQQSDSGYFFGKSIYSIQEIWICEDLNLGQKIRTLYHELMHVYLRSYMTYQERSFSEEELCDISSNSHDILHDIADKYTELLYEREEEEYGEI